MAVVLGAPEVGGDPIADAAREQELAARSGAEVTERVRDRLTALRQQAQAALEQSPRDRAEVAGLLRTLAQAGERLWSIEQQETRARMDTLVRIHDSMLTLRACESTQALIEAAPRELIRSCGFTRAMLSRVRGSLWVPEVLELVPGVDPEEASFRSYVTQAEIPLAHMLLEIELVRRRSPVLVSDPERNPRTYKPIVQVARSSSYAAAPIMPTSRVIGFFHVDRFGQELPVGAQDRENLWAFAEHFGLLYERAVLVDRIERQRSHLHELLTRAIGSIDEICEAEIGLARGKVVLTEPRGGAFAPRSPLDSLLTPREQEVLELMSSGATNSQIAQTLVVSEGTVKSHVKRILRKLRVDNRAGAVARYLSLVRKHAS